MARWDQVMSGEKTWGQYSLDVLGHAALGIAYSILPIAATVLWLDWGFMEAMMVGQPLALGFGALREWLQWRSTGYEPEKLHPTDRILDTLHHILGPPIAFGLVKLTEIFL